jgi:membrane protein YdbS with pleckstrin-like domain
MQDGDYETRTDIPAPEAMRRVDPSAKLLFRIRSIIPNSMLLLLATGGGIGVLFSGSTLAIAIGEITAGAFALLVIALWWFWPSLVWQHLAYRITPDLLVIQRGVLWRTETRVPRTRIQHTDVSQGPLERSFGLATLVVHTAGTRFATVDLPGLLTSDAEALRDALLGAIADDDV